MSNDYPSLAFKIDNNTEWLAAQRYLFKYGYTWKITGANIYDPDVESAWLLLNNPKASTNMTGHIQTVKDTSYIDPDAGRYTALDLLYDRVTELILIGEEQIPVDILIADDGEYKLYTDKSGSLFTAGCKKDLSKEQAINHWTKRLSQNPNSGSVGRRAKAFLAAIENFNPTADVEPMEIQQARARLQESKNAVELNKTKLDALLKEEQLKNADYLLDIRVPYIVKPNSDIPFYYIDGKAVRKCANCSSWESTSSNTLFTHQLIERGNCFRSEKGAKTYDKRSLALQRVNKLIMLYNNGWIPSWGKSKKGAGIISYSYATGKISCCFRRTSPCSELIPIKDRPTFEAIEVNITKEDIDIIWGVNAEA